MRCIKQNIYTCKKRNLSICELSACSFVASQRTIPFPYQPDMMPSSPYIWDIINITKNTDATLMYINTNLLWYRNSSISNRLELLRGCGHLCGHQRFDMVWSYLKKLKVDHGCSRVFDWANIWSANEIESSEAYCNPPYQFVSNAFHQRTPIKLHHLCW